MYLYISGLQSLVAAAQPTLPLLHLLIAFQSACSFPSPPKLSISSMKLTKSILGPVRATREGGAASFSFLSRRLRASGSLRGGQASPFFAIIGRRRGGAALENHEPSSPKVTCIGQVRVKSKKKVKQCRRRIGEVSFRMAAEQPHAGGDGAQQLDADRDRGWIRRQRFSSSRAHSHRDQRWVHLPILRAFRAEFCCFFPCRCSCFPTSGGEKNTRSGCHANENGCGAVLARWLVAANGGEGGKRREIEVVVGGGGGGDEERAEMVSFRRSRRHVFEDIEVKDDRIEVKGAEEEARVSICIPPKNALLLMRCRSDPMKMAALARRFSSYETENRVIEEEPDENDGDEAADAEEQVEVRGLFVGKQTVFVPKMDQVFEQDVELSEEQVIKNGAEANSEMEVGDNDSVREEGLVIASEEKERETHEVEEEREDVESNMSSFEALLDRENTEHLSESAKSDEREVAVEKEKHEETEESIDTKTQAKASEPGKTVVRKPAPSTKLEAEKPENQEPVIGDQEIENRGTPALPECLLLMMCEPKLSMEVSKETWIRGADFIRLLPERPRRQAKTTATSGGDHEPVKRRPSIDGKAKPRIPAPPQSKRNDQQPARSSCSLPAASAAAVAEQKQVNAGKCEPFALTRCKSEPMSTAAAKLMPEPCLWNNNGGMKLEPHRQAALGVGAAGAGC